ncbi:hypothetical protein MSPP1_002217 [Malassezia sp. CBS 17886]|nr:hypothetical protein MSPP1_002217 [Malassezia sp. CBS 17886]
MQRLLQYRIIRYPLLAAGAVVFTGTVVIGGLLIYDSMTYNRITDEEVAPVLAKADKGGPGCHPILPRPRKRSEGIPVEDRKKRLVVVGGGWAAVALLSKLDRDAYDVTMVSPNNYFLFTPLLPAASVGTVGFKSIAESLRRILWDCGGRYVQGAAVNMHVASALDAETLAKAENPAGLLEVEVISDEWDGRETKGRTVKSDALIYVPYDKLVIAVGSVTNTTRVSGLEYTFPLKTIQNAYFLRKRLIENMEMAALPTVTEEERRRLLSFVVCGGGPTGVEIAAEIYDMLDEDVHKYFPAPVRQLAKVHLIQGRGHILNTYSESISRFAEKRFREQHVDLVTHAHVTEVLPDAVIYTVKDPVTGESETRKLPSGLTIWSAGIDKAPFTQTLSTGLPDQGHAKALVVDEHLRVLGTPPGTVYAMGDASTVVYDIKGYMQKHFPHLDSDHDGKLSQPEFEQFVNSMRRKFPMTSLQLEDIDALFQKYDLNKDRCIGVNELAELVGDAMKDMTSMPPTAQFAAQEGKYLGKKFNAFARHSPAAVSNQVSESDYDPEDEIYQPFKFRSLGSIAYLGNAAAFDLPIDGPFHTFFGGLAVMYAWRSVYLSELRSFRSVRRLRLHD